MPITRTDPPFVATEREMLDAFLAFHQQTLLLKIDGLSDADLRRAVVPSGMTLLGMVKHLAYVHRWWFRIAFAGEDAPVPWSKDDPDADFRVEPHETTADIVALYNDEASKARAIVQSASLEAMAQHPARQTHSLRWILVHMVEEMARHNGHADIMRELIDGQTGE